MDQTLPIMAGVLAANLLTLMFVWGAYHAFKKDEDDLKIAHYAALLVPLAVAGLGVYAFT